MTASTFYLACKNNNIDELQTHLKTISVEDLNKIESNGSTALHVACYYGHEEIVKLLLEAGACRTILNIYNCTPYQEAKTDNIKELFNRITNNDNDSRFVANSGIMEWIRIDEQAAKRANDFRNGLAVHKKSSNFLTYISEFIFGNPITTKLLAYTSEKLNINDQNAINWFINQAMEKNDYVYFIKAYTAETKFYRRINSDLACLSDNEYKASMKKYLSSISRTLFESNYDKGAFSDQRIRWTSDATLIFTGALLHDTELRNQCYFKGTTYRGMQITIDELEQYKINTCILTKSFLSSSKNIKTAICFAYGDKILRQKPDGELIKYPILCKYIFNTPEYAFDISKYSEYPQEDEVLILPFSSFRINKNEQNSTNDMIELELEECQFSYWQYFSNWFN
ncbi:unnamed protein product [Didymodactylos carnosus]|uniref:NAD(+)--protein-arginine ADP-ribosyltransferase n=1 Tax=Didymodactylos carnosus TaxID=1234261 RepID=A0A8S2F310_9BILA|nr:unnamed protein product [Didymodactylos carnosus]CAF4176921.1 unnamed protein product [Didymodactylos carnosus]